METLFRYIAAPTQCGYLPNQLWSLEYEMISAITAAEYAERLEQGWRRFGGMLFRPRCPACQACQSLRVEVENFRPKRSQRRAWKLNADSVQVSIGPPKVSRSRLDLYDRFHQMQTERKDWPPHYPKDAGSYRESFVHNPGFTEEWTFHLNQRLVGVGYVDRLESCMSAIYFFYEPEQCDRSLGTFNVLCLLEACRRAKLEFLYLGYFVEGCQSLAYKANFTPNQVLQPDGTWGRFRD